jgi:3-oxochol-4-en-24-oyl-CoA dehydrogenase
MDFDLPGDDDPRRLAVRAWLAEHPEPTNAELHAAGYVVPHWPAPYGLGADPMHQLIVDDELGRSGVTRTPVSTNAIGVGWAAPTIYLAGSGWQRERFLDPIFRGDEFWCQLFSEPDSGSDLAGLGTRAVRDGDEYVINGSKIWTSGGHHAQFGILIARTDPDVPKHKGISYFIVPMDTPGITLTPIIDMTTAHSFNQTFFDDVRLHERYRVGAEGDGWRLAKMTLANERVSLSSSGSLWGTGPSAADLLGLVRAAGGLHDAVDRQRAAALHIEAEVLRLGRLRTLSAQLHGRTPGAEASIQKILGDEHGQHVMAFAKHLAGADGMLAGSGPAGPVSARATSSPTEVRFARGAASGFPDVDPIWH